MSAAGSAHSANPEQPRTVGRPLAKGYDPRRNPGGLSKAERLFREVLDTEIIPEAVGLTRALLEASRAGLASDPVDVRPLELLYKVCGLIKKPTNADQIQALAQELLQGMIAEAKRQREAGAPVAEQRQIEDRGTDE